jgi:hypothetical protein
MPRGIEIVLSGTAKVYCVHDREKRQLRTPDDCLRLVRHSAVPVEQLKFQTCGCCENVFPTLDDMPQLCPGCRRAPTHEPGGPLNDPIEGVI